MAAHQPAADLVHRDLQPLTTRARSRVEEVMSIKRSKEASRRRPQEREDTYWKKDTPERVYDWDTDVAAHARDGFVAYAPAHLYAKDDRVVHKAFGAGIVTNVEGPKI